MSQYTRGARVPPDARARRRPARVADPRAARRRATTCSTRPRSTCPWTYFLGLLDNLDDDQWVAIALNGRIVGLGQALPLQGTTTGILSTVLAPQLVTRGANTLTLYAISGDPGAPQLRDVPVYHGPGE